MQGFPDFRIPGTRRKQAPGTLPFVEEWRRPWARSPDGLSEWLAAD